MSGKDLDFMSFFFACCCSCLSRSWSSTAAPHPSALAVGGWGGVEEKQDNIRKRKESGENTDKELGLVRVGSNRLYTAQTRGFRSVYAMG